MFSSSNPRHDGESGFVLLAAIVLVVLLLISLAIAAPKVAQSIQRDKELETIHRGEQYRLAIKKYYTQFTAYPTSVKQLLNTNNMRFLRQEYTDPETGKDDWKPVLFGQAHVRPLGFFGKPLSAVGGIAASGALGGGMTPGMYAIQPTSTDANGVPIAGSGTDDTTDTTMPSSFGPGIASNNNTMGGSFGSSGQSEFGSSSGIGNSSFGQQNGGFGSSSGFGSNSGIGSSSGFGSNSGFGSQTGTGFGTSGAGGVNSTSGTTFGANGTGPIVGFTLTLKKPSLVDYMEQTAYNKWEFNYDPAADLLQQGVSLFGGGASVNNSNSATTAMGANSNGNNSLFPTQNGNSGTQNGNPGTPTGTNPTTPTTPQPQNPDNPQQ